MEALASQGAPVEGLTCAYHSSHCKSESLHVMKIGDLPVYSTLPVAPWDVLLQGAACPARGADADRAHPPRARRMCWQNIVPLQSPYSPPTVPIEKNHSPRTS